MLKRYMNTRLKDYKYKNRKVNIDGEERDALIVHGHTTLRGISYETKNLNNHPRDNIVNWYAECFILKNEIIKLNIL